MKIGVRVPAVALTAYAGFPSNLSSLLSSCCEVPHLSLRAPKDAILFRGFHRILYGDDRIITAVLRNSYSITAHLGVFPRFDSDLMPTRRVAISDNDRASRIVAQNRYLLPSTCSSGRLLELRFGS